MFLEGLRDGSETSVGGQVDLLPVCYWVLVYGLDLQMDFLFALGGWECLVSEWQVRSVGAEK